MRLTEQQVRLIQRLSKHDDFKEFVKILEQEKQNHFNAQITVPVLGNEQLRQIVGGAQVLDNILKAIENPEKQLIKQTQTNQN